MSNPTAAKPAATPAAAANAPSSSSSPSSSVPEVPQAPPCTMVILGAAGDLTRRLVVPALYNLVRAGRLPAAFRLVGVDRQQQSADDWRHSLGQAMEAAAASGARGEADMTALDPGAWQWLSERMSVVVGDLDDDGLYQRLGEHLATLDGQPGAPGNVLFYLAIGDRLFATAVDGLGRAGLTTEPKEAQNAQNAQDQPGPWRRVVIEKPFGHDLASAQALNADILKTLDERQIFRIDHFLGKEAVQNLMVLRFANGIFEPIWNRNHVDHVQITASETVGVEHRGSFYERTGALRDMVPNHLFQLLAMTAMEPPTSFDADAVRTKKSELIQAIRPLSPQDVARDFVRGQYGAGSVEGKSVQAYRQEPDVAPDSAVETYIAWRLVVDNWRWAGVPFYLRTGKHLAQRRTEIAIRFRQAPYSLFRGTDVEHTHPNWMVLRIQPDEGIALRFAVKTPGPTISLHSADLDFSYRDCFGSASGTGYETLIYDAMTGDATLFQRADNIEAGWQAVQPLLDAVNSGNGPELAIYPSGSDGPAAADALLARDGRSWRPLG